MTLNTLSSEEQVVASKVLRTVEGVSKCWKTKLEEYQKSGTELGTFLYKGAAESVGKTLGVLVSSMKTVRSLQTLQGLIIKSVCASCKREVYSLEVSILSYAHIWQISEQKIT